MMKAGIGTKLAVGIAVIAVTGAVAVALAPRTLAAEPEVVLYTTPT